MHELEETRISVLINARQGDFEDFVQIYVPLVYRLARGFALDENTACDVAQAALLDLVRQMPAFRYDPTKQFRHFVRRIVYRRKVDYLRRQRGESLESVARGRGLSADEMEELSDGNAAQRACEDQLDIEQQRIRLEAALQSIREEVRPATFQAFHLVMVQGKSVDLAARALHQTPNQVCQNKHRVLHKLRARLAKLFGHSS
jgi:RNA polymerase sigma-70 factor (ECF subfamily)